MDWDVFQRDVLDVLEQYSGFLDYFERVGSLSDSSRPDCFARISREEKREVWVLDAKKKPDIDQDDRQRMEKYLEMLKSNPIDLGLEVTEISDYDFRGIFVTSGEVYPENFEAVDFSSLHSFLQRELVYTDTDRVVRDVSKMMERQQLSQSQARVLFRSLKPYESRYSEGKKILKDLCADYSGLQVEETPFRSLRDDLPVDVVLSHKEREAKFLFDIPYSQDAVRSLDSKAAEIEQLIDREEVYYAAINTFSDSDSEYAISPEKVERQVRRKAGVISPGAVAELFDPKIRTEKEFRDGKIAVKSPSSDFRMAVSSSQDIIHSVEVKLPEKALDRIRDAKLNSRTEFGEIESERFRLDIEVTEDFRFRTPDTLDFEDFRDKVNSIYSSSVNPVLGKKASRKID